MTVINPSQAEHAIITHLRMEMKTQLLATLGFLPNPLKGTAFDGGGLMIAGSTVITIARNLRYQFKTNAQKSGDLDLYLIPDPNNPQLFESGLQDRAAFKNLHARVMPRLLETAFEKNGLRVVSGIPGKGFCTVESTFLPDALPHTFLESFAGTVPASKPYTVKLEIEAGPETPVFLLQPQQWAPSPPGGTPLFVDHPLNLFAQKLARAIKPTHNFKDSPYPEGFKIRDLMDILNLAEHHPPEDKPPLFDLKSDRETLRTLMVVNFARFEIDPTIVDFSVYENPSPQNVAQVQTAIHEKISGSLDVSEQEARALLAACASSLRHIFPEALGTGRISLTQQEYDFINRCNGLERTSHQALSACDPKPDASLLQREAAATFARHAGLAARIEAHPSLTGKAAAIRERRAELGNFGE